MHDPSPQTGQLSDQSAVRVLTVDDVRLTYVVDGAMGLKPEAFFPDLPAGYWAAHPGTLDERGRVAMSVGGLLVERDGRTLLIDAGLGTITGDDPFGLVNSGSLLDTLAALGRDRAGIEAVAFTHLHIDHTGWAFVPAEDGTYRRVFPGARYLVAAAEWAPHGRGESVPAAPPAAVIEQFGAAHTPVGDGEEVFPGVRAVVTPGHSPGHTSYVITSASGARLIALGDAFHVPAQLAHPEWPSAPDVDGDAVVAARHRLLAELEQPGTLGFAFHFGDQAFGRIERTQDGSPGWVPVPAAAVMAAPRQLD
ncbi:MAG TPA: MBL fold metallo-hydrolase [Trebonia sp.]|jgi:glyoxylase-like metal-dependent hydrolase (beta-lactamase superfamily II)|nr:MBL fold metallo-hydrolase [Trebonia sp.]